MKMGGGLLPSRCLGVGGDNAIRAFSEVGMDLTFPVDGDASGQKRGRFAVALTPLPPPKFNLLRTLPTPTRHVEEEGMASGLPAAWFRVSRGFF